MIKIKRIDKFEDKNLIETYFIIEDSSEETHVFTKNELTELQKQLASYKIEQ